MSNSGLTRQAANVLGFVALFAFFLLVPARTVHWRAGLILLGTLLIARAVSVAVLWRTSRALLIARAPLPLPQRGQTLADRLLLPAYMAAFAGLVAFSAWERWHRHLLPSLGVPVRAAGLAMFVAGWWVTHVALRTNAYAISVVRHQTDRGHQVVDHGAYAIVRHPMYAGMVLVLFGTPLWLGSLAGVVAAVVPLVVLALRIVFEERMLTRDLAGYRAFTERVRSRLVPGVW